MFTEKDNQQIREHGIDAKIIEDQIAHFKSGFPPSVLIDAATEGNGLHILDEKEADDLIRFYEGNKGSLEILKFVPASGAATRMFKSLFGFLNDYSGSEEDYSKLQADQSAGSVFTFLKKLQDVHETPKNASTQSDEPKWTISGDNSASYRIFRTQNCIVADNLFPSSCHLIS